MSEIEIHVESTDVEGIGQVTVTGDWISIAAIVGQIADNCSDPQAVLDALERSVNYPYGDLI